MLLELAQGSEFVLYLLGVVGRKGTAICSPIAGYVQACLRVLGCCGAVRGVVECGVASMSASAHEYLL